MKKTLLFVALALVAFNAHSQSYCTPTNDYVGTETWYRDYYFITDLSTTGATHDITFTEGSYPSEATSGTEGYLHHSADKIKVEPGQTITLNMRSNVPGAELHARLLCWIDFDGNGSFTDQGEQVLYLGANQQNNRAVLEDISTQITIPQNVTLGDSRIRFRYHDSWVPTPSSCGAVGGTTSYDFDVEFVNATDVPVQSQNELEIRYNAAQKMIRLANMDTEAQIEIYNLAGQLVKSSFASLLDVSDLNRNMYVVRVNMNNKNYVKKIVVL